ncbi:MAG: hypothetical protein HZB98_00660 [Bacteroidia bacterium]|nr:hypothetical protein [Bacteroidia bacterium]
MGLTSTQNVTYREINVKDADLIEDAFGFNCDFNDVVAFIRKVRFEPGEAITKRLIDNIKNIGQ